MSTDKLNSLIRRLQCGIKPYDEEVSDAAKELESLEREAYLQGLRRAATIAAEYGEEMMRASEIYDRINARIRFEEGHE